LPPELYPAIGEEYKFKVDDFPSAFPPFQLVINHYEESFFPSSSVFIYRCEDGTIALINIFDKTHNTSLSIRRLQNGKLTNDRNLRMLKSERRTTTSAPNTTSSGSSTVWNRRSGIIRRL